MAGSIVTIYIEDTSIRLMVARGKQVEKWAEMPLEPGLVNDGIITDEAEVAAKVKELLTVQRVHTKKVIAGLSGLHSLTKPIVLPQLPKALLGEAVMREAESVLPVPLDQLYLSWQVIGAFNEGVSVFLTALSRTAADALVKTLHQAGLDPYLMDSKPLALARVVNEATAIIADTQPAELDIIIMVDGIPQPVRSLAIHSRTTSVVDRLLKVKEDLEQIINFYNSNHPENQLDPETPVYISGELAQEPGAAKVLAKGLQHPVLPLPSPLKYPEDMPIGMYMVNIGLALKEISPPRAKASFSRVDINTLPDVYKTNSVSLIKTILLLFVIIVAVGLIFVSVMGVRLSAADTASLRSELDAMNQQIEQKLEQVQTRQKDIDELETELSKTEESRDAFAAVVKYIDVRRYQVNGGLEATMAELPGILDLNKIKHAIGGLTIEGVSPSEVEVLSYAKNLRESGKFSRVVIASMKKTEEGMGFGLALSLEE
ncbi:pilus assembly protein PilM [Chloroflexota bacterium]